ncbi:hypothetical protein GX51_07067 [Blastomyces parvus]|uniref:NACHT domain-containing protein n=1 Tax=Blastomyces parvus TaxID=2060905 RepID=A0A2B7WMS1_9EURO|nr:hypothetical protein GX51_07067 [Blastomyces parvus]
MNGVNTAYDQIECSLPKRRLRRGDYTVAWICALEVEQIAASVMFDEKHDPVSTDRGDSNVYQLGSINKHNVVMFGLYDTGNNAAATAVTQMKRTFPNIEYGLLVGIGGGVPTTTDNGAIRLGDVVVSKPVNGHGGAVQYDRGKAELGEFRCTSYLSRPPTALLNAAHSLAVQRATQFHDPIHRDIENIKSKYPGLRHFHHPGRNRDYLFQANYSHLEKGRSCDECGCDPSNLVQRPQCDNSDTNFVRVHRGTIATGERVIKNATLRDQLAQQHGVLCFEMEAAGVLTDCHFLVIRGISDYCDSHKSNEWHGYAAAVAAAYARQLFFHMPVFKTYNPMNTNDLDQHQIESVSNDTITKIVNSLKFDEVGDRQMSIETAHPKTCRWFLETPKYRNWLGSSSNSAHDGFLWIKGKPGAGKSTLMKFIVEHAMEMQNIIVISFFFHARGVALEKIAVGMYRSLLFQLFTNLPKLQTILCSPKYQTWETKDNFEWKVELLKDLFRDAVKFLGESSVMCFIDALDECDELEARKIVMFVHGLAEKSAVEQNGNFRVLFASRHYPNISSPGRVELQLDHQGGHADDIIKYIASELRIGGGNTAYAIRDEIQRKASGVFMWVVIVVKTLNLEHDGGCSPRRLRDKLLAIPDDLHQLFRDILTMDKNNSEEFLLCMQWLLFANRPLTPRELYLAILSGTNLNSEDLLEEGHTSIETIMKYLLKSSRGLAEKTKSAEPTMQFMHQSVRDFLLGKDGLDLLSPALKTNMLGQSHERLKHCCLDYIESVTISPDVRRRDTLSMDEAFPFLFYATRNTLYHAEVAERAGVSQAQFIANISGDKWYDPCSTSTSLDKISLLRVLAIDNLPNLIKIHPSNLSYADEEAGTRDSPLSIALDNGSYTAVLAFMEVQAQALPENPRLQSLFRTLCGQRFSAPYIRHDYYRGTYLLARAAQYCPPTFLDFLLETGRWMLEYRDEKGQTLLSRVVSLGVKPVVVRLLLEKYKVDVNSQDEKGLTPLAHAAGRAGYERVVDLLLQSPTINPNIASHRGCTPLGHAIITLSNTVPIVKRLLESPRVDPDWRDNFGQTPLSYAARFGRCDIVQLLLSTGKVDVDVKDYLDQTPLSHALLGKKNEIIQLLLSTGKVDIEWATANRFARPQKLAEVQIDPTYTFYSLRQARKTPPQSPNKLDRHIPENEEDQRLI